MLRKHMTKSNWNLKLLYKSPTDPQIEIDLQAIELAFQSFAKKFDLPEKKYLHDEDALLEILLAFEGLVNLSIDLRPLVYFANLKDVDSRNEKASQMLSIFSDRLTKADNAITFLRVSLSTISAENQSKFLKSEKLKHFRVFLDRVFSEAKHVLTIPEERILNRKAMPAHDMWIMGHEKILNAKTVEWKGKTIPLPQAQNIVHTFPSRNERLKLNERINTVLKEVAPVSEIEINALATNKKIDDEIRGFKTPYNNTVLNYKNDPAVVENLVKVVTDRFDVGHRYYKLKAKLLKLSNLNYCDRNVDIGKISAKYTFEQSLNLLTAIFGKLNPKYSSILKEYVKNGQVDAYPKAGKKGGAYCRGSYVEPSFILLNHTDDFHSFTTFAHEMGHSFHTVLSRGQGPMYADYSTSLAETASTLFENIALEAIFDSLPKKEQIVILHNKIGQDISTIFRQIACFNFEKDLHDAVRTTGYVTKETLADLHNKNMSAYLGSKVKLEKDDGYFFVTWSHIRRFFYVYSYAYGLLVSKALLRRYKADPSFWKSIEKFLSSGGSDSPENILKSIGIDLYKPDFFMEGIREIEEDIDRLEKLTR